MRYTPARIVVPFFHFYCSVERALEIEHVNRMFLKIRTIFRRTFQNKNLIETKIKPLVEHPQKIFLFFNGLRPLREGGGSTSADKKNRKKKEISL